MGRKRSKKMKKENRERKKKMPFLEPEIVEEKDFRGVVAVRFIQSLSNIIPKIFRV